MQHDTSNVLRLQRKMHMDMSQVLRLPRKTHFISENHATVCLSRKATFGIFYTRHHESRATQNDRTTSFETLKSKRFRRFSHRNSDATRKPDNRDETCRSLKMSMSRKTSSNVPTSCPTELQSSCHLKFDASCEASVNFHHMSQNATPATELARCHHLRQPGQCDSNNFTQHDTSSAAPAT